ncbi:cytochrome P450 [Gloeopeniophorella convolvens]|nr:cytochrome P450 [Gloeopeniophorella convolvens]
MTPLPLLAYPLALASSLILLRYIFRRRSGQLLPPGPKGWPLIGNLLEMPKETLERTYSRWARQYGGIVYVESVGQPIIIVNDATLANEMLDKKGSLYSGPPRHPMAGELAGFEDILGFLPYDRKCTQTRKYIYKTIGARNELAKHSQLFEARIHDFIKVLSRRSEDLDAAIRHSIGAIIILITYGYEVLENEDPFVRLVDIGMTNFNEVVNPGAYLVDAIPVLKYIPAWFPGAGFKRYAAKIREHNVNMTEAPFKWAKNAIATGNALPSFVSLNMEGKDLSDEEEHVLKWAATSLFAGGSDTSVAALLWFFLAMTLYPDAQGKAQAEIDRVIGSDRLPTLADRDSLPYVDALFSELIRWGVVTPIGGIRKASADDIHRGYHIPKGSIVIVNVWNMLRDPNIYPNPEEFSPERFLETGGKPVEQDPRVCAFGFGRRKCPGRHFADTVLWLTIATTLSVFRVSKVVKDSIEVTPNVQFTGSITRRPVDFECDIKPRSAHAEELILRS